MKPLPAHIESTMHLIERAFGQRLPEGEEYQSLVWLLGQGMKTADLRLLLESVFGRGDRARLEAVWAASFEPPQNASFEIVSKRLDEAGYETWLSEPW